MVLVFLLSVVSVACIACLLSPVAAAQQELPSLEQPPLVPLLPLLPLTPLQRRSRGVQLEPPELADSSGATLDDHVRALKERLHSEHYDHRIRPYLGVRPVEVNLSVQISDFEDISELSMEYTMCLNLYMSWRDERLAYSGYSMHSVVLQGDYANLLWRPDVILSNDKTATLHDITVINKMITVRGDGLIFYAIRLTAGINCPMDLRRYPHDSQQCCLELQSMAYGQDELRLRWAHGQSSVSGIDLVQLPAFTISSHHLSTLLHTTSLDVFDRLRVQFDLKRNLGHFFFSTFFPSISIVALSWNAFWLDIEANSARVGLGITTVLTLSTIDSNVRSSLPQVDYPKAIDIYLLTCFMFVFASLIEYAAIDFIYWRTRRHKKTCPERSAQMRQHIVEIYDEQEGPGRRTSAASTELPKAEEAETEFGALELMPSPRLSPPACSQWQTDGAKEAAGCPGSPQAPTQWPDGAPLADNGTPLRATEWRRVHAVPAAHAAAHDSPHANRQTLISTSESASGRPARGKLLHRHRTDTACRRCAASGRAAVARTQVRVGSGSRSARRRRRTVRQHFVHQLLRLKTLTHRLATPAAVGRPTYERDAVCQIDQYSRVFFPLFFTLFNIGYWIYFSDSPSSTG